MNVPRDANGMIDRRQVVIFPSLWHIAQDVKIVDELSIDHSGECERQAIKATSFFLSCKGSFEFLDSGFIPVRVVIDGTGDEVFPLKRNSRVSIFNHALTRRTEKIINPHLVKWGTSEVICPIAIHKATSKGFIHRLRNRLIYMDNVPIIRFTPGLRVLVRLNCVKGDG